MVSVPRYSKSLDHAVSDGFAAPMASGTMVGGEAWHAVDSTIVLVELGTIDGLAACVAGEVFRVPLLVQRCHYPSIDH